MQHFMTDLLLKSIEFGEPDKKASCDLHIYRTVNVATHEEYTKTASFTLNVFLPLGTQQVRQTLSDSGPDGLSGEGTERPCRASEA